MNSSQQESLAQHYKLLELPIGASLQEVESRYRRLRAKFTGGKRRNINGHPAFKFLPKLDRAFNTLKEAHLHPDTVPEAVSTAFQPIQNSTQSDQSNPSVRSRLSVNDRKPAQSKSKSESLALVGAADIAHSLQQSTLNCQPTYVPQTHFIPGSSLKEAPAFTINYTSGNIFDAVEDRAVLVHAVNCQGIWGMGIAYQIKKDLPGAFCVYETHCRRHHSDLVGTCLLIPPQPDDYEVRDQSRTVFSHRRWVACLFTSAGYGKKNTARDNPGRDPPNKILAQTKTALGDFRMQLEAFGPTNFNEDENWRTDDEKPGKILAVKLNSGAFAVPWNSTEALIKETFQGFERPWYVFDGSVPPEPTNKGPRKNEAWVIPEAPDE